MTQGWYLLPGAPTWTAPAAIPGSPPVGTVRLMSGTVTELLTGPFLRDADDHEWMPLVIHSPSLTDSDRSSLTKRLRPHPVLFISGPSVPTPVQVLAKIHDRPMPPPATGREFLFRHYEKSGGHPGYDAIFEPLCALPARTWRYFVHRRLGCTTTDLHWLWRLATGPRLCPTVDALAEAHRATAPQLRSWVSRLVGVPARHYNRCPGWEWVLFAAVQNGLLKPRPADGRTEAGRRRRKHWDEPLELWEGRTAGQRGRKVVAATMETRRPIWARVSSLTVTPCDSR